MKLAKAGAPDLDGQALEIATMIHELHKNSWWAQQYLLQQVKVELERLDREWNEAEEVGG